MLLLSYVIVRSRARAGNMGIEQRSHILPICFSLFLLVR